jgi:hypothetical protein
MTNAITHATEMITGNLGGYVILHDSNGDGKPDEILIMNTENPETSTEIWRWNKNGLGFANSYDGNYETAITQDGQIVANFITAGVLNANVIKAGILSDANGNSSIDMTSGIAKLKNMLAKLSFKLVDTNEVTKVAIEHTGGQGTRFRMYESNANALVDLWAYGGAGAENLNNSNGNQIASMGANDYGGAFNLSNSSGTRIARLITATNGGGYFSLHDSSNNQTIYAYGSSGNIYCVKVNETSSIKVKKNVKPIEDAERILELQAVSFDFKDENRGTDQRGFIAEDVAKIIPSLVSDGEIPSIHYTGMIPYLQDVIKKQQKKIDELESKLNAIIEKIGG